ncbi:hypothetical protein JCM15765_34330 [Paradesulfitobacterium aromaticivorans]
MALLIQQLLSGLLQALFLFLLAAGLSLIFGVSRVLNLAHGAFYMLGAYVFYTVMRYSPSAFWLALLISVLIIGCLGAVVEVLALRRSYAGGLLYEALVTFATTLIIEELVRIGWGSQFLTVPRPPFLDGGLSLWGLSLPKYQLVILLAGILIGLGMWWIVYRTRWGVFIRAASMDREMLAALGINVTRIFTLVFVFGVMLAGLAGALAAPTLALSPNMDSQIIMDTFAVVVVGGLGNLKGSLLSAILIGEIQSVSLLFWPGIGLPIVFLLMALILLIRPQGLLTKGHA